MTRTDTGGGSSSGAPPTTRRTLGFLVFLVSLALALAVLALDSGVLAVGAGRAQTPASPVPSEPVAPVALPDRVPVTAPAPPPTLDTEQPLTVTAADPVAVRIPRIGVDAAVGPLHVRTDGSLAAPEDYHAAGWWRDGPEPGENGPAVIAGHVDDWRGPAVFHRLRDLTAGDEVHVDRADGSTATFVVTRVSSAPKDEFPTAEVYGATPAPELRLITCGGAFDRRAKSYVDNLIVFAVLAG